MTVTAEINTANLAELVKQVQEGHSVVLTRENEPVARIVPAEEVVSREEGQKRLQELRRVRTFKGHKVLQPKFDRAEVADEMYRRE